NWVEYVPDGSTRSTDSKVFQTEGNWATMPQIDGQNGLFRMSDGTVKPVEESLWNMTERRLVSLRDDGKNAVYMHEKVTDHNSIPKEGEFRDKLPTRPLEAFETRAIDELKKGKELLVETSAGEMRMVGAIRAKEACIACHKSNKVGDLLGAFTYRVDAVSLA